MSGFRARYLNRLTIPPFRDAEDIKRTEIIKHLRPFAVIAESNRQSAPLVRMPAEGLEPSPCRFSHLGRLTAPPLELCRDSYRLGELNPRPWVMKPKA